MSGRVIQAAVLVSIAAAVYLNTLPNGFVIDDLHQIVENEWVTGPGHLPAVFTHGVWDFEGRRSNYYRPLMYVLYMGAYSIAGRAPWAYHLLNILLHVAATLLVLSLGRRLLPRGDPRAFWWLAPPFVAALLFAVHPIHTEPVAWSAGIPDLGVTVFGLLALCLHASAGDRGWSRDAWAALAWLLALLCKETAVVIPVLVAAHDLLFVEPGQRMRRAARAAVCFTPVAAAYLALRLQALGGLTPVTVDATLGASAYVRSVLVLLAKYMEMLVLPVGLNVWHAFSPPVSWTAGEVLRATAVLGLVAATALAAAGNRAARFAFVLIIVPLLPAFHVGALTQGLENVFAERYLYLPSVGFVFLLALALDNVRRRGWLRPVAAIAVVVVLAGAYAAATVSRNRVWKDHLTLWSDAVRKSPGSAVAHMNHGAALIYAGHQAQGVAEMRRAAAMNPDLVGREVAKAAAYLGKGLHAKAILTLHTALALDPAFAPAHYNLGLVYEARGQVQAAVAEYRQALAVDSNYPEAHNNLGILLAEQQRVDEALEHFEAAVRARPSDPELRLNLARAYDIKGRTADAEDQRALAAMAGVRPRQ